MVGNFTLHRVGRDTKTCSNSLRAYAQQNSHTEINEPCHKDFFIQLTSFLDFATSVSYVLSVRHSLTSFLIFIGIGMLSRYHQPIGEILVALLEV